jgi:hypothetical protein
LSFGFFTGCGNILFTFRRAFAWWWGVRLALVNWCAFIGLHFGRRFLTLGFFGTFRRLVRRSICLCTLIRSGRCLCLLGLFFTAPLFLFGLAILLTLDSFFASCLLNHMGGFMGH